MTYILALTHSAPPMRPCADVPISIGQISWADSWRIKSLVEATRDWLVQNPNAVVRFPCAYHGLTLRGK